MDELEKAKAKVLTGWEGKKIMLLTEKGIQRVATVRLKKIKCGKKNCKKCPHETYAYAQYRVGKRVYEKYLGVAR